MLGRLHFTDLTVRMYVSSDRVEFMVNGTKDLNMFVWTKPSEELSVSGVQEKFGLTN